MLVLQASYLVEARDFEVTHYFYTVRFRKVLGNETSHPISSISRRVDINFKQGCLGNITKELSRFLLVNYLTLKKKKRISVADFLGFKQLVNFIFLLFISFHLTLQPRKQLIKIRKKNFEKLNKKKGKTTWV